MRYLVDTHLLVWATFDRKRVPAEAAAIIDDPANVLSFSVVSIWEVVIKSALRRPDFLFDGAATRAALIGVGYREINVEASHVLAVADLPRLHGDPFDRLLLAQARAEGLRLLTGDRMLARYGEAILI